MKKLTCHDVGVDCDAEFIAETEGEVLQKAAAHAAESHNLPVIPPHIEKQCREAISDVEG